MFDREFHIVTGAAGFIGSQLVDNLLSSGYRVIGIDNFVRGTRENLSSALENRQFSFIELDLTQESQANLALAGLKNKVEIIWHLAANSDIAAGNADPKIDLRDTFLTSFVIAQIAKQLNVRKLAFSSTSAIYGDLGDVELHEDIGPLFPISNYGAMKLASEACFTALAESSLDKLFVFRFPNVVGGRATHGVIFDFLNKLEESPDILHVLGDGTQCKPYLEVTDLISAMRMIVSQSRRKINCFNIGPEDSGLSVKSIAEAVVGVASPSAQIFYGAEARGWVGDVPRFRYSISRLKSLGWKPRFKSSEEAVAHAIVLQFKERRSRSPH